MIYIGVVCGDGMVDVYVIKLLVVSVEFSVMLISIVIGISYVLMCLFG